MITTDLTGNLGNHLFQYAVCRTVAEDAGLEWGINPVPYGDYYGGANQMDFMDIDFGKSIENIQYEYQEKVTQIQHVDTVNIHHYDPDIVKNIKDNTKLTGCFQTEKYFLHNKESVKKWLSIKPDKIIEYEKRLKEANLELDENTCVINIRGGEYKGYPLLVLGKQYFENAMQHIRNHADIGQEIKFVVISDDPNYAQGILGLPTYHFDIGMDYYVINSARWLILSNSSFAWFPAWLNEIYRMVIAPKYWARHNVSDGYWACSDIQTKGWVYLDKENRLFDYEDCILEKKNCKYYN